MINSSLDTGLNERDLETIHEILKKFPEINLVYLFGSRAMGNFKTGSDIDLAIMDQQVSETTISRLKSDFEESSLPYFIDLINYPTLAHAELKEHIDRVGIEFYKR